MISESNIRVNRDLCYACGICVERCILDNLRLSVAPCRSACPINMNCQGYIRLLAQGKEKEAAEEMRLFTPFGAILGRVCSQPCEAYCERGKVDGPVHIRAIKRYLADYFPDIAFQTPPKQDNDGKKVAVVGSGPAGLAAAYELSSRGHSVTIFEKENDLGGALRHIIPSFRLPVGIVDRTIEMLAKMGIDFRTSQGVGQNVDFHWLEDHYDGIILAIGANAPMNFGFFGEDSDGVISGMDLLRKIKKGEQIALGQSIIIIGGGNSAVDAALACKKLKITEVRIVCLEGRREMPAFERELKEAEEEGVIIEAGWGPKRMEKNSKGKFTIEFMRCLSVFDSLKNFNPCFDPRCNLTLEADAVIAAIGQKVETVGFPDELIDPKLNLFAGDQVTHQSLHHPKVFVCGDAFSGPSSVVHCINSGQEAAISLDRFLRGERLRWGRGFWTGPYVKDYKVDLSSAKGEGRGELNKLPVNKREINLETETVFSSDQARKEAERCLSCGRAVEWNKTCWYCLPCEIECPVRALEVRIPYLIR